MERPLSLKPINIQDENSLVHRKKAALDGKSKISRPLARKGGVAVESRKALNDITNKSSNHLEATSQSKMSGKKRSDIVENGSLQQNVPRLEVRSKKNVSVNEKLNIAEEGFLHDHRKCIDAQKAPASLHHFLDTVLPGQGSTDQILEPTKDNPDNCCINLEEISMSEFSDCFKSSWKSPPPSPPPRDCPPPYPSLMEFEAFDLVLKEDDCGGV